MTLVVLPFAASIAVAGPHTQVVRGFDAGPFVGTAEEVATAFVAERAAELPVSVDTLRVDRSQTWRGRTAVRLQQQVHGIDVAGAYAIVQVEADGRVDHLTTQLVSGLSVDPADIAVTSDQAQRIALGAISGTGAAAGPPSLIVERLHQGRIAWRVDVQTEAPHGRWQVAVAADTGEVLRRRDLRAYADGRAYPTNLGVGLETVTLDGLDAGATQLNGDYAICKSAVFEGSTRTFEYTAIADGSGDFLYEPNNTADDPFAEVNAYYHVTEVSKWFEDTFGKTFDGPTSVTTNYRDSDSGVYDNAYFTYDLFTGFYSLTFGHGSDIDFGHDPDVVVHEFGHGVTEDLAQLFLELAYPVNMDEFGLHPAPGGLTEGIPDYWAVTYFDDSSLGNFGLGALRELDNDHTCPGDILGEAHVDGEFVGGTLWEIRELVGAEATDQMVWGMLQLITTSPGFEEVSEGLLSAAADLVTDGLLTEDQIVEIEEVLDARGMSSCGRAIDIASSTGDAYWIGADIMDESLCDVFRMFGVAITPPFQYEVSSPEEAEVEALEITIRLDGVLGSLGSDDLDWSMSIRKGDLVEFEMTSFDFGDVSFDLPVSPMLYDLKFDTDEEEFSVTLTADDIDLEGGETYTIALSGMNCVSTWVDVDAALIYDPVDTGGPEDTAPGTDTEQDTGTDDDDDDDVIDSGGEAGGCGCASGSAPSALWLAGLVALAVRRRS